MEPTAEYKEWTFSDIVIQFAKTRAKVQKMEQESPKTRKSNQKQTKTNPQGKIVVQNPEQKSETHSKETQSRKQGNTVPGRAQHTSHWWKHPQVYLYPQTPSDPDLLVLELCETQWSGFPDRVGWKCQCLTPIQDQNLQMVNGM